MQIRIRRHKRKCKNGEIKIYPMYVSIKTNLVHNISYLRSHKDRFNFTYVKSETIDDEFFEKAILNLEEIIRE